MSRSKQTCPRCGLEFRTQKAKGGHHAQSFGCSIPVQITTLLQLLEKADNTRRDMCGYVQQDAFDDTITNKNRRTT